MILPREFYERDTLTVASDLLGQILVREMDEGTIRAAIVETEAYLGRKDDAAHSYKGKSERVRVQYGPGGMAYIYMIYGLYYCLNITTGPIGEPEVVLLRALEPLEGLELMKKRRSSDKLKGLCSGPGKLCMAFNIDRTLYGANLCEPGPLYIEKGGTPDRISTSKRIGIDYAVTSRDALWRFTVSGSAYLSRPE